MPRPSEDRRCSSDSTEVSAILTCGGLAGAHQSERLQLGDQSLRVSRSLRLLFGLQCFLQEGGNLILGPRRLQQQLQDCDGCGIQQVGVPGQRVEDDCLVFKYVHSQVIDGGEPHAWRFSKTRHRLGSGAQPAPRPELNDV
jgi:hypothetical protein